MEREEAWKKMMEILVVIVGIGRGWEGMGDETDAVTIVVTTREGDLVV